MSKITTPRGEIITVKTSGGTTTTRLNWNPDFSNRRTKQFSRQQKFVDSEVLRYSDKYIPMDTGMLKKSGTLGTVVGSGNIQYIAPYARKQYHFGRMPGTSSTGAERGRLWFARMKAAHKKDILEGAKKIE